MDSTRHTGGKPWRWRRNELAAFTRQGNAVEISAYPKTVAWAYGPMGLCHGFGIGEYSILRPAESNNGNSSRESLESQMIQVIGANRRKVDRAEAARLLSTLQQEIS